MTTYLIGAEKGGVGKTSTAVNLAAVRAGMGRDVLLIDTDGMGSAQEWIAIRNASYLSTLKQLPIITCVGMHNNTVAQEVRKLVGKFDDVIIDAGGKDSIQLRSGMLVADMIITPTLPGQFDIFSLSTMDRLVGEAKAFNEKLRAVVLINGADTNLAMTDVRDMRAYLTELPLQHYTVLNAQIYRRVAIRRCATAGLGVMEFPKSEQDEKAVSEMLALNKEIW